MKLYFTHWARHSLRTVLFCLGATLSLYVLTFFLALTHHDSNSKIIHSNQDYQLLLS